MIIPLVSSLTEDVLSAVPRGLREAAYGLGATKFEVSTRVVLPAGLSGVFASFILAISRAVGETMAVVLAAGMRPQITLNPLTSIETMTTYIVAGDRRRGVVRRAQVPLAVRRRADALRDHADAQYHLGPGVAAFSRGLPMSPSPQSRGSTPIAGCGGCSARSSGRPACWRPVRAWWCWPCSWARSWPRRSRGRPSIPGMRSAPISRELFAPGPPAGDRRRSRRDPALAGYRVGIAGSLWLLGLVAVIGIPVGVGAGVFLEEYAPPGRLRRIIQTNIANLAGVPSIVYGILGLALFVRAFGIKALALGPTLLAGVLDAQPLDPADHRDHDAGGAAGRAAVAPPGGPGAGRDALAGGPRPRAARRRCRAS